MKKLVKRKLKKFVHQINPDITVHFAKKFECDVNDYSIFIETQSNKKDAQMFKKWYQNYFREKLNKKDLFYISLLHEIGHLMTYTRELDIERDKQWETIGTSLLLGLISTEQANEEYFEIPMELTATEWARNYYNNYVKKS